MKIAVTTENGMVFQHFGKTKTFTLYETEGTEIRSKALLDAGENGHSALAAFLKEQGVDLLICGGIGGGAKDALRAAGVKLAAGAAGSVDQAVRDYLEGRFVPNNELTCNHHEHGHGGEHSCGGHTCGH